jgi:hypothetical protein
MIRQYKITTENICQDTDQDCVLNPADPVNDLKRMQYLGGIGYQPYVPEGINVSKSGMENQRLEKQHGIKPGTPEWFQLWFSLPYLTGEPKVGKRQ